MENNEIFEAEAAVEGGEYEQNGAEHTNRNSSGPTAIMAGLAPTIEEERALLPKGPGNGDARDEDNNGNADTGWPGVADFDGLLWWKRPSIYWLLPAYAAAAVAIGGLTVPRLSLVISLICREYLTERSIAQPGFTFAPVVLSKDNPQCHIPEVQALSTKFMLYIGLIGGVLAAIVTPKIGALSDRYGRTSLLALTATGGLVGEVITIFAAKYPDNIHYTWLLVGACADGICGSFIAGQAMTHSYVTDCTPPAKRGVAFGYLQSCLFVGIALGPVFAAYLEEATDSVITVFYFGFLVHSLFCCYVLFVVPESVSRKRQLAAREKFSIQPRDGRHIFARMKSANFLAPLMILYPTGDTSSSQLRMNLLLLSGISTIVFGSAIASVTVVLLYAKYQFLWNDNETNLFLSFANICRVSALMILLPLLNYIFRTRYRNRVRRESGVELLERNSGSDNLDLWTIRASLVFEVVGFGGYALAGTSPLFVLSAVFASIGGIGSPIIQSALTKHVPHDRTGQLLGAAGLLHGLARVVFPTGVSMIYASTIETFPQTVFIILVGCFGTALLCSLFVRPHVYLEDYRAMPSAGDTLGPEGSITTI